MNNILSYILIVALVIFSSCDKNVHSEEGVAVALEIPLTDKAGGIDIRVFNSKDTLTYIYKFANLQELSSSLLPLLPGEYTLVATLGAEGHFATREAIDSTTLEELLSVMKVPNSSPSHVHYGIATKVLSVREASTNAVIKASRIFADLEISIIGLADNIVKVEVIIHNIAKGFYPAVQKLTPECCSVHLGERVPTADSVKFHPHRLMPVVKMSDADSELDSKVDSEIKTVSEFIFHYKRENGEITKISFDATLPEMKSGGIYKPVIDFNVFREGITVDIKINGWGEGSENEGEILDPVYK